jgi:hypothetical protein
MTHKLSKCNLSTSVTSCLYLNMKCLRLELNNNNRIITTCVSKGLKQRHGVVTLQSKHHPNYAHLQIHL